MRILLSGVALLAFPVCLSLIAAAPFGGVDTAPASDYKLLEPITHGDLTVFPVVSSKNRDTSTFLTLDEGIRSGEVVVTEAGNLHSTMIRRPHTQTYQYGSGARVNTLVLVNNSQRPLILLAGEIVTGGKQDRVVGKDRIVPGESDPVDLGVFCVEPHRWVESSTKFDTHASVMAQPSVRKKAMVEKDQQQVWNEVNNAKGAMASSAMTARAAATPAGGSAEFNYSIAAGQLNSTSSYAKARENPIVEKQVEAITGPMQKSYESLISQLRNQNAVGVVVAVKGRIVWADLFASTSLLGKYWPKLLQSYAAEALTTYGEHREVSMKQAQEFLDNWQSRHETVDSEPGLYRQRELVGDRFRAFELTSLLPKATYDVHLSKMAE
jgi:hypothetical protein